MYCLNIYIGSRVLAGMRISREEQKRITEEYRLVGVHCVSCKRVLEDELSKIPGVEEAVVDPATGMLKITLSEEVDRARLLQAIRRLGYDMYVETTYFQVQSGLEPSIVEERLKKIKGIVDASYNQSTGLLRIDYDPEKLSVEKLREGLESLGLKVESSEDAKRSQARGKTSLALASASLLVFLGSKMAGFYAGEALAGILAVAAALPSFIVPALRAAVRGYTTMDTLLTLGVMGAAGASLYSEIVGGPPFWDAAVFITFFVLAGRYVEDRLRARAESILEEARKILPGKARVLRNGRVEEVSAEDVRAGETVIVAAGERVPVDGRVASGEALVDESVLTGESEPVRRVEGDIVLAGSLVVQGTLQVTALRTGRFRLVERILYASRQASLYKPRIQRIADRVASIFTPVVLAVSAATLAYHTLIAGATIAEALRYSLAVLVVSCPCAFGIAIPAAMAAATAMAHRFGVILRSPDALDSIARARIVAFDKTGTLTIGKPRVVEYREYDSSVDSLELAASLETASAHPLARAVVEYYRELRGRDPPPPEMAEEVPGHGIIGRVSNHDVAVGGWRMLEAYNIERPPEESRGKTRIYVIVDGRLTAELDITDPPRPEARLVVKELENLGFEAYILSGDEKGPVEQVAQEVGIPLERVRWSLDPAEKAAWIRNLSARSPIVYVGDGVNDAAAMSEAAVGVAVNGAVDIAKSSADAVIAVDKLTPLLSLVRLARKTKGIVYSNIAWAFAYNILLIPIAAGALAGYGVTITPGMAAAAMSISSMTVTTNSLRLLLFSKK